MESLKLLRLLPVLVLIFGSAVAGDELRTFIVHVFSTADDRTAWYNSFLPENNHHVASGFAARLTQQELDALSTVPGFVTALPNKVYKLLTTHTPAFLGLDMRQAGRNHSAGSGDGVIIGVPDITGPGVSVLAAWPFAVGPPGSQLLPGPTYNFESKATPHLSGIAALIKSKHPDWSPAAIKFAIMTTADSTDKSGDPIVDEQHKPVDLFATGAGHVNPDKAVDPGLVYDIAPADYIGFLCGMYTSKEVSVIARRSVDCSTVTVIPDRMLNYPSISVKLPSTTNPTVSRTVRNVGVVPAVYQPKVDLPAAVQVKVTPSSLPFTDANQVQNITLSMWRGQSTTAKYVQGSLQWVSDKHTVRSPISVSFA